MYTLMAVWEEFPMEKVRAAVEAVPCCLRLVQVAISYKILELLLLGYKYVLAHDVCYWILQLGIDA